MTPVMKPAKRAGVNRRDFEGGPLGVSVQIQRSPRPHQRNAAPGGGPGVAEEGRPASTERGRLSLRNQDCTGHSTARVGGASRGGETTRATPPSGPPRVASPQTQKSPDAWRATGLPKVNFEQETSMTSIAREPALVTPGDDDAGVRRHLRAIELARMVSQGSRRRYGLGVPEPRFLGLVAHMEAWLRNLEMGTSPEEQTWLDAVSQGAKAPQRPAVVLDDMVIESLAGDPSAEGCGFCVDCLEGGAE